MDLVQNPESLCNGQASVIAAKMIFLAFAVRVQVQSELPLPENLVREHYVLPSLLQQTHAKARFISIIRGKVGV